MLEEILNANIFAFFLVFARLGGAMMLLPGFGEPAVSPRVRLSITLAVALAVFPLLGERLPQMPATLAGLVALIGAELLVGVVVGGAAKVITSALHVAGTIISFQSSLALARTMDPTARSQGAIVVSLFNIMGVVLIFATGLHYMLLRALVDSYTLFPPGNLPPMGDFAALVTRFVAGAFALGLQIATPLVVYGIVFYICLGLLGRLMPRIQLFFIVMPLQIMLSLTIIAIVLPVVMLWFIDYFEASMAAFLVAR